MDTSRTVRDLSDIRKDIDAIDKKLLELFETRMELTAQVAAYKQSVGMPVLDPVREREKLDTLSALAKKPENRDSIRRLFESVMAVSRSQQKQILETAKTRQEEK